MRNINFAEKISNLNICSSYFSCTNLEIFHTCIKITLCNIFEDLINNMHTILLHLCKLLLYYLHHVAGYMWLLDKGKRAYKMCICSLIYKLIKDKKCAYMTFANIESVPMNLQHTNLAYFGF